MQGRCNKVLKSMRTLWVCVLLAASTCALPLSAREPNDPAAEAEIREVVERFRAAIVAGDGDALRALFLARHGAWISLDRRSSSPEASGSSRLVPSSYRKFARNIERGGREEIFSGVDIRTDGSVASVDFDFEFLIKGKRINRGLEAWHLVKTDAGWKIVSVVYSSNPPGE